MSLGCICDIRCQNIATPAFENIQIVIGALQLFSKMFQNIYIITEQLSSSSAD